jgi:hypothetical protein
MFMVATSGGKIDKLAVSRTAIGARNAVRHRSGIGFHERHESRALPRRNPRLCASVDR